VRDLAAAVIQALTRPIEGHVTLLLAAADVTSNGRTSRELVRDLMPAVEWRGGPEYESDPFRSLVDASRARSLLDWQPQHTWRDYVESAAARKSPILPWRR
jgi:nucleoside-diphosphate-sugar epimerase